ncbi:unnamed protein product [Prunus armeniaca]|uniref:Protein kinase domain-containing protein n=1 Tax=Prunus armeniaca TaxID=36596 RepID=A0A6J5ULL0_PRUAR|nr:unnamed protein product [Prunus armeniaca]
MEPYSTAQQEVVASLAYLSTICRETPQRQSIRLWLWSLISSRTQCQPAGIHVGIDINSLKSNITMPWNDDIAQGKQNNVWISYNSSSKNLSVAFTSFLNDTNGIQVEITSYLSYIVDLKQYLPDWVIVGFSAATSNELAVHKILSWNFTSTALVDEGNKPVFPASIPAVKPKSSGSANIRLFIGWVAVRRRAAGERDENTFVNKLIHEKLEKGTGPRKFSYRELVRGTSNFEEGEKLGEGGFGGVYRGFIKDLNSYVAVKRISSGSKQGLKEYASEVRIISYLGIEIWCNSLVGATKKARL